LSFVDLPFHLELYLFAVASALVLDVEYSARGDMDAFSSDLDHEWLARLDAISKPPQLRNKLRAGVGFLDITLGFAGCHQDSSSSKLGLWATVVVSFGGQ
jgi:hypothetical protein